MQKIKTKTSSINRNPLVTIDDQRIIDWLVPQKAIGALALKSDEVFLGEGLTWRQVEKSSRTTTKGRNSSRTKFRTFERKAKSGGPSANEHEEDIESSDLESSSEDKSYGVELKIYVIDLEDSEWEFSKKDWERDSHESPYELIAFELDFEMCLRTIFELFELLDYVWFLFELLLFIVCACWKYCFSLFI